jgi:SNF2 family DNA or RNA helicase
MGHSVTSLLEAYKGINPYLKKLRNDYLKNNKIQLTDTQIKYIQDNHEREPMLINRVVKITPYLGEELQKKYELKFQPEKILIEYMLAENEKAYHIYGKLKRNQVESSMYWVPKTQVLDDPYFEEINMDVDFDKYNDILAKFGKKLYSHQESGPKFLLGRNGCILADDMGLGKSMQSIIAALESGAERILVVCPASAKINWKREIEVFCKDVTIIDGKRWDKAKFTIINYDILKNFHTLQDKDIKKALPENLLNRQLVNAKFDLAIVDEAHNLSNAKSARSEIMVEVLVKHAVPKVWLLTGTPITNRPINFYNLLKLIKSPLANDWMYYTRRYCDAKKFFRTLKNGMKKQIWLTDGASNLDELAVKTKNLILRRLKKDVLDMPDKIIIPSYLDLTPKSRREYEDLWDEYLLKRAMAKKKGEPQRDLVEIILLRKFIAMEAIPATIELVENAIELGKKVIIFTNFSDELAELEEHFGNLCVTHHGSMNAKEKQKSVDAFQEKDKIKVFIGNVKSAGVAITLTKANIVVFNSFEWVPGLNEQAEDRAYRIGQNDDVTVYYQMFLETISTRMWDTLRAKQDVISTIMGDKKLSEEEIIEIMTDKMMEDHG